MTKPSPNTGEKAPQKPWTKLALGISAAVLTAATAVDAAKAVVKTHFHNHTLFNQVLVTNKSGAPLTILTDVPSNKEADAHKAGLQTDHKFAVTIPPGGKNPDYTDSDLIPVVNEPITVLTPSGATVCPPGSFIRTSGRLNATLERDHHTLKITATKPLPLDNYSSLLCLPPENEMVKGITSSFQAGQTNPDDSFELNFRKFREQKKQLPTLTKSPAPK
jgi:hypothetical protein